MKPPGPARVERRLAAILAADVAGYSRLIEADEEGTLARLKTLRRELLDPKIAEHRGRLVKTTGDAAAPAADPSTSRNFTDVASGWGDCPGTAQAAHPATTGARVRLSDKSSDVDYLPMCDPCGGAALFAEPGPYCHTVLQCATCG